MMSLSLTAPGLAQAPSYADRFGTVSGLRLHYLEWGDPARPALILLHGIARHAHTFDHIAPGLARDYRVIEMRVGDVENDLAAELARLETSLVEGR